MDFPDLESSFATWLSSAIQRCDDVGIVGFCFNLSETSDEFLVELVGSSSYDPTDDDWACDEVWTSRPDQFRLPYDRVGGDWEPVLAMVAEWVGKRVRDDSDQRFQVLRGVRAVAVGFVDGDLTTVWSQ